MSTFESVRVPLGPTVTPEVKIVLRMRVDKKEKCILTKTGVEGRRF